MKRWQDWANGVLGVGLIAAPWVLGFAQAHGVAAWSAWILGAAILVVALAARVVSEAWRGGLVLLLRICSIAPPRVLGYRADSPPMVGAGVIGAPGAPPSIWAAFSEP